jgi:hypothetical protein
MSRCGPARGLSRPGPAAPFARLAPGQGASPHRQDRRPSRLFKARRPNDPRRLPSARTTALRPRWSASRELFARSLRPGTLLRAAMGPAAVRGGRSPPHATPAFLRAPCDARAPARRRCSLPTSATDSRHVHQTNRSIPRVAPRSRAAPRPMERMPQQTTQVVMRLTAHPELRSITSSRARRSGGCGRHPILPSPRSKSGPQVAPPVRGVVFRGRVERVDH